MRMNPFPLILLAIALPSGHALGQGLSVPPSGVLPTPRVVSSLYDGRASVSGQSESAPAPAPAPATPVAAKPVPPRATVTKPAAQPQLGLRGVPHGLRTYVRKPSRPATLPPQNVADVRTTASINTQQASNTPAYQPRAYTAPAYPPQAYATQAPAPRTQDAPVKRGFFSFGSNSAPAPAQPYAPSVATPTAPSAPYVPTASAAAPQPAPQSTTSSWTSALGSIFNRAPRTQQSGRGLFGGQSEPVAQAAPVQRTSPIY